MEKLVHNLKNLLPGVTFTQEDSFSWSPDTSTITYKKLPLDNLYEVDKPQYTWALLHEASHALLGHKTYKKDVDLLLMEVAAWEKAKNLALQFNIKINEGHIQDCLDTYRDWLHQRSTCPRCGTISLQVSAYTYNCFNCSSVWHVTTSRFCRAYRISIASNKKSPEELLPQATFR